MVLKPFMMTSASTGTLRVIVPEPLGVSIVVAPDGLIGSLGVPAAGAEGGVGFLAGAGFLGGARVGSTAVVGFWAGVGVSEAEVTSVSAQQQSQQQQTGQHTGG